MNTNEYVHANMNHVRQRHVLSDDALNTSSKAYIQTPKYSSVIQRLTYRKRQVPVPWPVGICFLYFQQEVVSCRTDGFGKYYLSYTRDTDIFMSIIG